MIQLRVNAKKLLAESTQTPHLKKLREKFKSNFPRLFFSPIRLIQYKYSSSLLYRGRHGYLSRITYTSTPSFIKFYKSAKHNNMMMSIFSHFEIALGQKWRFSWGMGPVKVANSKPNTEGTSSSADAESKTARKDPNPSSPGGPKQNPPCLRPRFAPELDGLHCFESIVPC
ncbi:hypothetical protein E2542_SST02779 [Spatholobus suberectus]|nr:hypothetical protein E2542_SST02779 [Spatholobus suberectus]